MTERAFGGIRGDLDQTGGSTLQRYRSVVFGDGSLWHLLVFEFLTAVLGPLRGRVGARLRRFFYPLFLGETGARIILGSRVSLRHPRKIRIGERAIIGDGVALDARGEGASITLRRRVSIGPGTIVNCRGGSLVMEDGVDIGDRCRIGSLAGLFIGANTVIGHSVCLAGAGHSAERTDVPIVRQPVTCKGPIRIGPDVTIGAGATVLDGVRIGAGSIVEPGSLVNRDLPAGARAGGVPATVRSDAREGVEPERHPPPHGPPLPERGGSGEGLRFLAVPGALGLVLRRWALRKVFAFCGRGVLFGRHLRLRSPERIRLGEGVILGDGCVLDGGGGPRSRIVVGDGVFVSAGTTLRAGDGTLQIGRGSSVGGFCLLEGGAGLVLGDHVLLAAYTTLRGGEEGDRPTRVGDGCWLGVRTAVTEGTTIGNDSVIGAHAVVRDDLPSLCVAYGNPARPVRSRV